MAISNGKARRDLGWVPTLEVDWIVQENRYFAATKARPIACEKESNVDAIMETLFWNNGWDNISWNRFD